MDGNPHDVFFGDVEAIVAQRQQALSDAYNAHPERFIAGPPWVKRPPARVCINPADGEPPTMANVIDTDDDKLAELWPPAPTAPLVINIPGAPMIEVAT